MPECVYCGRDAGLFDEHETCVEESLRQAALEDTEPCRITLEWRSRPQPPAIPGQESLL